MLIFFILPSHSFVVLAVKNILCLYWLFVLRSYCCPRVRYLVMLVRVVLYGGHPVPRLGGPEILYILTWPLCIHSPDSVVVFYRSGVFPPCIDRLPNLNAGTHFFPKRGELC